MNLFTQIVVTIGRVNPDGVQMLGTGFYHGTVTTMCKRQTTTDRKLKKKTIVQRQKKELKFADSICKSCLQED